MRADRLLSILLLLQVHKRLTAGELARELEVSERTVLRDMDALSASGVPVIAERGKGGGWRLLHAYRTNLTGLNTAEMRTLFLPVASRLLSDLGMGKAAETARIKMSASLPGASLPEVERVRQRIHIDGAGWYPSAEAFPLLPFLQEAVWNDSRLHLHYERGDGVAVERVVDPLGLVAKGRTWYLVAQTEGEVRSYRVSRIVSADVNGESFLRPAGFDLPIFWERSVADFKANVPRYPVIARLSPALLLQIEKTGSPRLEGSEYADTEGWSTRTLLLEAEHEACDFILRHAPAIEVLDPIALRERVYAMASAVAALHRN